MSRWGQNTWDIEDGMIIALTKKNETFLLSVEDQPLLSLYTWSKNNRGYFHAKIYGKIVLLHRKVMDMGEDDERIVDHINGDRSDNRRENLRIGTYAENMMNKGTNKSSKSGHKGVTWDKRRKKWIVRIQHEGIQEHLGSFNDVNAAITVYKKRADELFGNWARK